MYLSCCMPMMCAMQLVPHLPSAVCDRERAKCSRPKAVVHMPRAPRARSHLRGQARRWVSRGRDAHEAEARRHDKPAHGHALAEWSSWCGGRHGLTLNVLDSSWLKRSCVRQDGPAHVTDGTLQHGASEPGHVTTQVWCSRAAAVL